MEQSEVIDGRRFKPELVSVVIPTYNGRADLEVLLPKMLGQQVDFPFEIVCVDSGSTDGTWELLGRYPVRRHQIPKGQFSHGGTRNLGIGLTSGDIVVLMTQDAIPLDEHLLASLVANYADPVVGGVYARQVPRPNGTLLPKIDLSISQNGKTVRSLNNIKEHPDYRLLPPLRQRELCNFDNICSSMRRKAWEKIHLQKRSFAEDLDWGKRAFESGWTIVYEPKAAVMHSHDRSFWYEIKRSFITYDVIRELFGYRHQFTFSQLVKTIKGLRDSLRRSFPEQIRMSSRTERMRAYWIILARLLGQWFYSSWQNSGRDGSDGWSLTVRKFFYSGV
jgi:rhamnosyltransferase